MSYKKLEIWRLARELSIKVHRLSLTLPKFELYESGSQIRRASKSVRFNIVEGYGRRQYKKDYIRFLIYAQASNDETRDILRSLYETGSLKDDKIFKELSNLSDLLGKKLNLFIQSLSK